MSVSPAQNFSKPPPVPEIPTVTLTSGFSSRNSSAAASRERSDRAGAVDLDRAGEVSGTLPLLSSPQAATNTGSASTAIAAGIRKRERTRALLFSLSSFIEDQRRGRRRAAG